jgi:hypothetical protein
VGERRWSRIRLCESSPRLGARQKTDRAGEPLRGSALFYGLFRIHVPYSNQNMETRLRGAGCVDIRSHDIRFTG